jgi:type III restriction enzyme
MQLKGFQQSVLHKLGEYLDTVQLLRDPERAFAMKAEPVAGHIAPYRKIRGLEDVPYVCLRLPTGGGKTIVAAHAVKQARG